MQRVEYLQPCHSQCSNGCSGPGAEQCTACKNYQIQDSGVCVETCPNEYYADQYQCKHCSDTCETCTYVSTKQVMCLKCKSGYLLVEGKGTCEKTCDKGYYKDDNMHHCRVCSGVCDECIMNKNKCTACRSGQMLEKDSCVPEREPCPAGSFQTLSGCQTCPEGCFSCTGHSNCTCCNKGSYLQNGSCVPSCDSGFQPLHVNYSSKFVFQQCQQCGNECNVCPDGFKYIKGVCIQQNNCPDGTYFQWNSMSCKKCNTSCRACIGPSNTDCLSCYPPSGYNNLLRKCMKCCSEYEGSSKAKDCCHCIEDGKCEIKAPPPSPAERLYGVATIIIVLLVIVICALVIFAVVAIVITCRKQKDHPNVHYKQLISNENEFENDNLEA